MPYYRLDMYYRCSGDGCVFDIQEDFYSSSSECPSVLDFFFDSDRSDILWHNTRSYDEALSYYMEMGSERSRIVDDLDECVEEDIDEDNDEAWPICEPFYFETSGKIPESVTSSRGNNHQPFEFAH
ncbi:MAG: hypothetical protein H7836_12820 [Magnetococcus sp. YQC-3]